MGAAVVAILWIVFLVLLLLLAITGIAVLLFRLWKHGSVHNPPRSGNGKKS